MNISIQSKGGTPIYEQIATQIKEAILAGKLNKDDAILVELPKCSSSVCR